MMSQYSYLKNSQLLQQLMQQVGIEDLDQLSSISGVSLWQLMRLQHGLIEKMQLETLLKISKALQVSLSKLVETFTNDSRLSGNQKPEEESATLTSLKQEYQRLQQQMDQQRESLRENFQQASLQTLESWLIQWPTAAAAVHKNPQLPAERLLPLVKPVEHLLEQWGIEAIASVGEQVSYDPQWHELNKGNAEPGDTVQVRYVGYKQGDKLLYRAKVSPIESNSNS